MIEQWSNGTDITTILVNNVEQNQLAFNCYNDRTVEQCNGYVDCISEQR